MGIKNYLRENKYRSNLVFIANLIIYKLRLLKNVYIRSKKSIIIDKYKVIFGNDPNLKHPNSLNEKIQWMKLYDHQDFYTICADKYAVREYLSKQFGPDFLIPLIFQTSDWREITPENIRKYPCIVKANHTSKDYVIIRDPNKVDWQELRYKSRWWLHRDYYAESLEWQYKNIKRKIIVEELLQTSEGRIPNDYKLHYINGKLQFIYVSVDREGCNARNIYDSDWHPLFFSWDGQDKKAESRRGPEIDPPQSFEQMKSIGAKIARNFKYVRVDYYDVDGKLFFGEITLHHGGGFDVFIPEKYDLHYGQLLNIQ